MQTSKPISAIVENKASIGYQVQTSLYLQQATKLIKAELGLFATFTLVYFAFLFMVYRLGETGSFINLFVAGPISAGYYLTIHRMNSNIDYRFESFFDGFRIYFPVMVAAMATNLLISLGALLYIVPGLIIAVFLLFVMPLVVFGELELFQAIKSSGMLVKKEFWEIFKFSLIIVLINAAGVLTFGIGLLFTIPFSFAAIYFAYNDIIGFDKIEAEEPKTDFSHFR